METNLKTYASETYVTDKVAEVKSTAFKESLVQEVIAALGTPVFGTISTTNDIILTGNLIPGTYTIKYEDSREQTIEIGNITITGTYTNMIPKAINADGTEFVGANGEDGYKTGYRLNSSGTEAAHDGINVTGYIPVNFEDTIYIKNMEYLMGNQNKGHYCYISTYNSNFTMLTSDKAANQDLHATYITDPETNQLISFTLDDTNYLPTVAYIRISYVASTEKPILSINEPISGAEEDNPSEDTLINLIPLSINSDGSDFVGTNGEDGYKTGIRLNSSGAEADFTGWETTGFIPVTQNSKIYFSGIDWNSDGQSKDYLALYNSSFSCIGSQTIVSSWLTGTNKDNVLAEGQCSFDNNGNLTYLDFNRLVSGHFAGSDTTTLSTMAYFRISACGITDNSIISVSQPTA